MSYNDKVLAQIETLISALVASHKPKLKIKIRKIHPQLGRLIPMPKRMSRHASGFDVSAAIDEPILLPPQGRVLIPTGFAMEVPPGYECQVRPRSGLSFREGVTVLNSPGTLDADYRGELKIILINHGSESVWIDPGNRIAQIVFAAVEQPELEVAETLGDTERGADGMGSTGV
jgi:dUTP pyrophosphatase